MSAKRDDDRPITPQMQNRLVAAAQEAADSTAQLMGNLYEIRRNWGSRFSRDTRIVLDAIDFGLLTRFEIVTLLGDMVKVGSDFSALLYSRLLLLSIYESTKTLRTVLDHEFRAAFLDLVPGEEWDERLKNCHSDLNRFFDQLAKSFGEVRKGVAGHRDPDYETRLKLLDAAHPEDIADVAIRFAEITQPLLVADNAYLSALREQLEEPPNR